MKKGDVVTHRLSGEKMIIVDSNLWNQMCCRRLNLSSIWLEEEELEVVKSERNGVGNGSK